MEQAVLTTEVENGGRESVTDEKGNGTKIFIKFNRSNNILNYGTPLKANNEINGVSKSHLLSCKCVEDRNLSKVKTHILTI